MDIKAILKRIENGDRSAFALVVQDFQHPLFGYLGRMGLNQGLAEEIAQETFLRAWKRLNDYDASRGEFSTWLFAIARNLALHELDRASCKREAASDETLPEFVCEGGQPFDALELNQQRQRLASALRNLSVGDRSVLALAYLQELDLAAIARIEGCSTAAIKVRLHRARQRLSRLMEKEHE